ncbi:putative O-glycosylation ligase, exosortase A system-associated [Noviherbaspirillum sedimenti]|uniref:Putative O-glycosylation ligase, exosortase A system-associated n=1 Tax=Noviherbaspirillum sedimenti TaxID=2320865 RepID=A0A3A3G0D0_9BURK|nr:putative O-glycosylation ligase, exosortase A system-associated [Noviherbaspirillum sedimenti]RJG01893.1 putative O-glycosylation ligase, exosortase A system-associated [Noviherbaspirillum sedimenti]
MRDLLIFAIVFGSLPYILKRPAIGVLMFTWISLMNPHRLTYGAAYAFPFAAVLGAVTLLSLLFTREPKRFPVTPVTLTLIVFLAWMTFTSFFALEPGLVWKEWDRVMKSLFIILIAMLVLNTEKDIKAFVWVVGLSLGIYGLKGGIFTLASGGSHKVWGPEGSYIYENNSLALAFIATLPIIWYMRVHADKKWLRIGLTGMVICTVIAAVGSYSRGALLGGGVMLFFLWLKSPKKILTGSALIFIVLLVYAVMPEQWFARMQTIDNFQEDASAMGRFNAWYFAINVATNHFLGGGFNVFSPRMFLAYAPNPLDYHVAHSIYFQVLGDHGFIGLTMYLLLMYFSWRTGTRIIKFCKEKEELKWASDLAKMVQVSIIGFAVGGAFLSLAYFDLYYDIILILVLLEKVLILNSNRDGHVPQQKTRTPAPNKINKFQNDLTH